MTKDKPSDAAPARTSADDRQARSAQALRANLQKRKALTRAKAGKRAGDTSTDEPPTS